MERLWDQVKVNGHAIFAVAFSSWVLQITMPDEHWIRKTWSPPGPGSPAACSSQPVNRTQTCDERDIHTVQHLLHQWKWLSIWDTCSFYAQDRCDQLGPRLHSHRASADHRSWAAPENRSSAHPSPKWPAVIEFRNPALPDKHQPTLSSRSSLGNSPTARLWRSTAPPLYRAVACPLSLILCSWSDRIPEVPGVLHRPYLLSICGVVLETVQQIQRSDMGTVEVPWATCCWGMKDDIGLLEESKMV